MGKCGKEPARPLEEEQSRSLSSRLDPLGFKSVVVVLLGSAVFSSGRQRLRFMAGLPPVEDLERHVLSGCACEYRGFLVFKVSYEGGDVENGQPEQVQAWSSSMCEEQENRLVTYTAPCLQ